MKSDSILPFSLSRQINHLVFTIDRFGYLPQAINKRIITIATPLIALTADLFGNIALGLIKKCTSKNEFDRKIISLHFREAQNGFKNFTHSFIELFPRLFVPKSIKLNPPEVYALREVLYSHDQEGKKAEALASMQSTITDLITEYPEESELVKTLSHNIHTCINHSDKDGLKMIAYKLFQCRHQNGDNILEYGTAAHQLRILMHLFENSDAYVFDIGLVIFKAFQEYKDEILRIKNILPGEMKNEEVKQSTEIKTDYWGKTKGQDPEELVEFSHGGGLHYITSFLSGDAKGYKLERSASLGLQVSPRISGEASDRDFEYSLKSIQYFDEPARLQGKIKAKYLDIAPNFYEAGLRSENIQHVESAIVNVFSFSKGYKPHCIPLIGPFKHDTFKRTYSKPQLERLEFIYETIYETNCL